MENGKEKYKIIKYFSKISNKWFFFKEENGKNKRNMLSDYDVGDEDNNNVMIPAGSYILSCSSPILKTDDNAK